MMAAAQTPAWRGEMRYKEPMGRHNSWRTGGPARRFYQPADLDDLCVFLGGLDPQEPLLWLGLGSNLLVRDGGFPGTVISTLNVLSGMDWLQDTVLRAGAGATCSKVARTAAKAGMVGAEFLAGIPGTMGGALAMNAGAFGGETWNLVRAVQTVDRHGRLRRRTPGDFRIAYRSVQGPADEWFVSAELQLQPGNAEASLTGIRELLARRSATQPTRQPSCGSVFRNPTGDHAARLIESAGLKGRRIGGACVSEKHANFIINTGTATANDLESLIVLVQDTVERQHGIRLQTEVRIVGEEVRA
jgi:UDP-N-acetylmuramate dehydrogenase